MLRSYVQRITVAAVWMRFHTHWGVNMQHVHFHCRSPPLTLQRKKKEARSDCCQKVTQWIFGHAVYIIHQIYQWFMRFENCGASKDLSCFLGQLSAGVLCTKILLQTFGTECHAEAKAVSPKAVPTSNVLVFFLF